VRHSKDGTKKIYTYREETMDREVGLQGEDSANHTWPVQTPEVEALLVLDLLEDKGTMRFGEILRGVEGVSQKMLTKTLRQMECDGLITRTVHPVIPPHVDYELTEIGRSLTCAFCGVWMWAAQHHEKVKAARAKYVPTSV
jgi:DNA-binding HxlR family transcriptional regulator